MSPRTPTMDCEICHRQHHPHQLPFYCAVDARNVLYEGRLSNARVLIEKEELEQRVNALLLGSEPGSATPAPNRASQAYVENCASEEQKARDRTEQIISAADTLRERVENAKKEIQERKAAVARRKSDLASVSQGIPARRAKEIEETKKAIRMTKYMWDREYEAMTHYRAALCNEVAKLYRLQRIKRGNPLRFEYKIGGIEIVDLHQMNNTPPEVISASLAHIAHLLWLASHYLAIRVPAEITLPHNDYPRPTVSSLHSSYNHGELAFPGSSSKDMPLPEDPRDRQYQQVPHPRPLFLDRPLSSLLKEDPQNYNAFLEGVCLLAYDIVWLCRTQGVSVGENTNSFEDFALMGRNLYNLLVNTALQRNHAQSLVPEANRGSGQEAPSELGKGTPKMGAYSHGTAHTYLGGTTGQELTRSFKLPNPVRLVDRLKARLGSQTPTHNDWDIIENDEIGPTDLDDGVFIGGTPQSLSRVPRSTMDESYMSVTTVKGSNGDPNTPPVGLALRDKEKAANGWTKIKPR